MDMLAWRSTKTLCGLPFSEFVVLFLCNAQRSDILNVKQRKQLRRKGAHCIRTFFFRRGCARMRLSPKEILSLDKSIWNSLTTEGQEVYRNGVPMLGQQLEQRFILEVQEHVMGKCYLTHGPKGLDIELFLHKNKVLRSDSDLVGAQMHHLSKRAPWDSCTPTMLSSPTLLSCTSQPESPVSFAPCATCGRRGASKKKKVWVHGLMQRAPRLVGSSRENKTQTYL